MQDSRPITVHDVLTFRLGLGMDFEAPWPQPLLDAMGELGLGSGPPEPQTPPAPDESLTAPLPHEVNANANEAASAMRARRWIR